jgi:hypothetical protein
MNGEVKNRRSQGISLGSLGSQRERFSALAFAGPRLSRTLAPRVAIGASPARARLPPAISNLCSVRLPSALSISFSFLDQKPRRAGKDRGDHPHDMLGLATTPFSVFVYPP